jgi:hypothetical protein
MRSSRHRIVLPYPSRLSPDSEASRAHALEWITKQAMLTDPDALRAYDQALFHILAARAYPNARGSNLDLANKWQAWFFIFDDLFDGPLGRETQVVDAIVEEYVSVLQPTLPRHQLTSPLISAFIDMWEESNLGMSETWKARCTQHTRDHLLSYKREALGRLHGVSGDLESYLDIRHESIGVPTSLDLAERLDGYELSQVLHDSEPMSSMRLLCAEVIVVTNDIFSAAKEAASAQMQNLVLLRMRDGNCGHAAAEEWAEGLLAERVRAFAQAERRMRQGVQTETEWSNVDRYISAMKSWMQANLDWSYETPRYGSTEQLRA